MSERTLPRWYRPLFHLNFTDDCGTMLGVTLRSAVRMWFLGRGRQDLLGGRNGCWWRVKHAEVCFGRNSKNVWVWRRIW